MSCQCPECQASRDDSGDPYLIDENDRIGAFLALGFTEDYAIEMVWGSKFDFPDVYFNTAPTDEQIVTTILSDRQHEAWTHEVTVSDLLDVIKSFNKLRSSFK